MPIFNHNRGEIYYSVQGDGDPIVLIHGFGLDSRMWNKQVTELSKTNKVITYDMRGFGKSSLPVGKYSHQEDLHELLKSLNISESKIVGHSFGGEVATEYALKYPNEVKSLVLISPALSGVKGDSTEWESLTELGKNGDIEGIRKQMLKSPIFKNLKEGSEEFKLITEMVNDYSGYHFQNRDPREYIKASERLKELDCPIEVVVGENDEEIQKEIANIFKEELGIEPRVIPNSGHMVVLENAELVSDIIKGSEYNL
jgi:pimeloyl-ACP methyl ester carboxylesterase